MNNVNEQAKEKQERIIKDRLGEKEAQAMEQAMSSATSSGGVDFDRSLITDISKIPPANFAPYRGVRVGWFCYHPAYHGTDEFAFDRALEVFMGQWNDWWDIVQVYQKEMILSEKVTIPELKKDLQKLLNETSKKRKVYVLEALAEALWDKEGAQQNLDGSFHGTSEKTQRHEIPYMYELERRAEEIQAMDCGISLANPIPRNMLTRHTWSG